MMGGTNHTRYRPKLGRELDVPGHKVIKPVNDHLAGTVDHRNYCLRKGSSRYDEDVTHNSPNMTKMIAVQMNRRAVYGRGQRSIILFR